MVGRDQSPTKREANDRSICNDEELNIVLLRLVEYLGHTNSLVHGVAYDEVTIF